MVGGSVTKKNILATIARDGDLSAEMVLWTELGPNRSLLGSLIECNSNCNFLKPISALFPHIYKYIYISMTNIHKLTR